MIFPYDPPSESVCYKYVRGEYAVTEYFRQAYTSDDIVPSMDTEQHGGRAWSMQVSVQPRTGILIRADDRAGLEALDFWFNSSFMEWAIAMHHAAHDLEWARRMKVQILRYRDTLQEAFHLGNLPQGLKPLVYRLFRHTMTSYEETVRPASLRALQDWMLEAIQIAQLDLSYTELVHLKTKVKEVIKKGELESLLTRLLRLVDVESEYDPWERLDPFWNDPLNEWMRDHVEARIGHYPILGIGNCSMDEAVRYAVGDADWTGRAAVELARRRDGAFHIYQGDKDV